MPTHSIAQQPTGPHITVSQNPDAYRNGAGELECGDSGTCYVATYRNTEFAAYRTPAGHTAFVTTTIGTGYSYRMEVSEVVLDDGSTSVALLGEDGAVLIGGGFETVQFSAPIPFRARMEANAAVSLVVADDDYGRLELTIDDLEYLIDRATSLISLCAVDGICGGQENRFTCELDCGTYQDPAPPNPTGDFIANLIRGFIGSCAASAPFDSGSHSWMLAMCFVAAIWRIRRARRRSSP